MYVAKFNRDSIFWIVTIFEKRWSESMLSNELIEINRKVFILHASGYRWINSEMTRILFDQHKLEIVNG
jgi:hypothetical protein